MPKNIELLQARNIHVRTRYKLLCKRNPKWRVDAILKELSLEVFLSEVTIVKILKADDKAVKVPSAPTVSKHVKQQAAA